MTPRIGTTLCALLLVVGCKERAPSTEQPPAAPQTPPAAAPANPTPSAPTLAPSGPRSEVNDARFSLVFALGEGAAAADPARLSIELRGSGGYHVNDQYPIAVDLSFENASAEKSALRRGDAAELSQAVARFELPVRSAGEHPVVRGRMRFAVCTEAQCAFETREFALRR